MTAARILILQYSVCLPRIVIISYSTVYVFKLHGNAVLLLCMLYPYAVFLLHCAVHRYTASTAAAIADSALRFKEPTVATMAAAPSALAIQKSKS